MQGKAKVNGVELNYRIDGREDGPGIVMGNSLGTNYSMWDDQVKVLKTDFRILRMDKRGHGGSDPGETDFTIDDLGNDVVALSDALGFIDCHYIGLSIGGMIGQSIGMNHPYKFKSLILCATTSQVPAESYPIWEDRILSAQTDGMSSLVQSTLERWFSPAYRRNNQSKVARIGEMVAATSPLGYVRCCRAIMGMAFTDSIRSILTPTLVVPGELDPALPVPMSEIIRDRIPGARMEVVANAAHLCNIEQSESFNSIILKWLSSRT